MKNLLTHSFVLLSLIWSISASGQSSFCKKVSLGTPNPEGIITKMRPTPDGNLLISASSSAGYGLIKMTNTGTIIDANRIAGSTDFDHAITDAWELPNGDLLSIVAYDENPASSLGTHLFIKRFTPSFTELWSQNIPFASAGHRPEIAPAGAGQFYVFMSNHPEGRIVKMSETGQILWAKILNTNILKVSSLPNGNIAVSHRRTNINQKASLSLLSPNGLVIKSIELPNYNGWDCEMNIFPGGDILLSVDVSDGVRYQRLSSDLSPKKVWQISCPSDLFSGYNAATIVNDSLIYFRWPTPSGSGILGTMDGNGIIKKSILLTRFFSSISSSGYELSAGPNGWCGISSLLDEPGMLLYSLDSTLTLPGCTLPLFTCLESKPVEVANLPASVTSTPITFGNYQHSLPWQPFPISVIDTCFVITPPDPFFDLPELVCVGQSASPASVNTANANGVEWIIDPENAASDTSYLPIPNITFDKPGLVKVLHKIHYLGCQTDSFSRMVLVLPSPTVELGPDTSSCTTTSILINAVVEGAIEWYWNDQDTSTQKQIVQNGIYFLEATNGICSASDTIEINLGKPNAAFGVVPGVCSGEFFTPVPDEMTALNHLWQWNPAVLPDAVTEQPIFGINLPGTYQLSHIVTLGACSDTSTQAVLVVPPAQISLPPSALICSDSILQLLPDTVQVLEFYWENGATALERDITNAGIYSITAFNGYCLDTATIEVLEQICEPVDIYIPNVFAPNANDANAKFEAYYNNSVAGVDLMEIYDRWGSLVFRTSAGESWDGGINGRPAAPGVYVYVATFSLVDGSKIVRKGTVTLVR